ncbi:Cna B-type domain-containing protein [Eggerthellaceae bacterium zg-1084]|uniref:Cna B-type domain-containing protein n=1 Tax=Berryella wangjianweii TaxID=2734634 RepID=UPI0015556656|nr:Cna B-type domain-containing protein [Berryella wangjianweii]NPD30630.1 Cna B-type domain-containing protein [Berryella wangjianweii]
MHLPTNRLVAMTIALLLALTALAPAAIADPHPDVVAIGDAAYPSLDAAVAAAATGDTLTLTTDTELPAPLIVPPGKRLIIDLNGHTLTSRIADPKGSAIVAAGDGALTVRNGSIVGIDADGDGFTGRALLAKRAAVTLDRLNIGDFHLKGSPLSALGGAISMDAVESATITDCSLHDNSVGGSSRIARGGAIALTTAPSGTADVLIQSTRIENNAVTDGTGSVVGGGLAISGGGTIRIVNSTIAGNRAVGGDACDEADGGGISIIHNRSSDSAKVTLEGNVITGNAVDGAQRCLGGGLHLWLKAESGDTIDLPTGVFEGNRSAQFGGAIDYTTLYQPTLTLHNAVITGNAAATGGGVWACPSSRVQWHTTLGGAILDNALIDGGGIVASSGTDVRFEGSDTDLMPNHPNDPAVNTVTVAPRTFTGERIRWYADEPDHPYTAGDDEVAPDYYTARSTSFGLYGATEGEGAAGALPAADVVFRNNVAGLIGGAIATNSPLQVGDPQDVEVTVTKRWVDASGTDLTADIPDTIGVVLVQIDENGAERALDHVQLTATDGWTHTFTQLPARGKANGAVVAYRYEVREAESAEGFTAKDPVVTRVDDTHTSVALTNVAAPAATSVAVSKVWEGEPAAQATVRLLADGAEVGSAVLTAENGWQHTFADLPLKANGQLIAYTVTEDALEGYDSVVSGSADGGFTVTNTKRVPPSNPPTPSVPPVTPPAPPTPATPEPPVVVPPAPNQPANPTATVPATGDTATHPLVAISAAGAIGALALALTRRSAR